MLWSQLQMQLNDINEKAIDQWIGAIDHIWEGNLMDNPKLPLYMFSLFDDEHIRRRSQLVEPL